jgi:hypothetical protein
MMGKSATSSGDRFVICVDNEGYPASLEKRKVYQEMPDPAAAKQNLIRVIDESGQDYLFPRDLFLPIELSAEARDAILRAS